MCADRSFACCFASVSSFRRVLLTAGMCLVLLAVSASAYAAGTTLTVTTLTDPTTPGTCASGSCTTLRAAIAQANKDNAGDTIQFGATLSGTLTLISGLSVTGSMAIQGPTTGAGVTISGAGKYTVFTITSGTVSISDLTIADGSGSTGGGALVNGGTLTVTNSTFYGNIATTSGGAIDSAGVLTVTNSTFAGNSSKSGNGGAIYLSGGTATVVNDTFARNTAASGDAIYNTGAALTVENSILSDSGDATTECSGSGCPTSGTDGNYIGMGADLLPLGNYGGTTPTMLPLPLPTSSAICSGLAADVPGGVTSTTTDQRGFLLSGGSPCVSGKVDAGAVQTNYSHPTNLNSTYSANEDVDLSGLSAPPTGAAITIGSGAEVNLIGPGADKLTVTGGGSSPVFTVDSGAQAVFYGMTITDGNSGISGISNSGALTVLNSAVSGNKAANGGGIENTGALTVLGTTISGNTVTGSGAGIDNGSSGALTVINSTISGNTAATNGGGINNGSNSITVTNSTISGNTATAGSGGGIESTGTLTAANTIIEGNTATTVSAHPDLDGSCMDSGTTDTTCSATGGNLINAGTSAVPVNLAGLADNSGPNGIPTATMLPIPGTGTSAICAGEKSLAVDQYRLSLTTDQRGAAFGRSSQTGGYCSSGQVDAGAVQTDYTSIQFANLGSSTGYSSDKGIAVSVPAAPIVSVTENGLSAAGVPITLAFSGTGAATGVGAGTSGTAYSNIVVNQISGGTPDTLTASLAAPLASIPAASADLTIVNPVTATVAHSSETLTANQPSANFTPVTGSGGAGTLSYSIAPALPTGLSIDSTSGAIKGIPIPATTPVTTAYTVTITDGSGATATGTFALTVNSAVSATSAGLTETLTMNHAATSFTPVTATGGTGALTFTISPTLPTGLSIDSTTGTISGTPSVVSAQATYTVTATDTNQAAASGTFTLTVSAGLTPTVAVGSETLTAKQAAPSFTPVTATGGTAPLKYSVSPTLPTGLTMASDTGAITGTPTTASVATNYTVTVTDANQATTTGVFSLTVSAAVSATVAVAAKVLTVSQPSASFTPVTGSGGTGTLSYAISPGLPAGLSFSTTTGTVTGSPTSASAAATYTVTVKDANNATSTASFSLTVNAVVTATVAVSSESLTANQAATSFMPVTGGGGTAPLSYGVSPALPAGLSMSPSTGAVSGTATTVGTAANYTVTVKDANGATATASFSLTVNAAVSATVAAPSETLTANQAASFTPVTGSGGTKPLTYSVSPALPPGLSISSSTGAISGKPTTASATAAYTVTVKDANGATTTASFSLTVNGALVATQVAPSETLTANHATSFTPVTGSGGTKPLTYSVSPALPAGLSISSSTGAISGEPTAASATVAYTVTIKDVNGVTATANFSLTVKAAVTATATVAPETLTATQAPVSFTPVTGAGGTGALSYSVSPALPAGLSISSTTGTIGGTPTAASPAGIYTVTVVDTNSASAAASFGLTVNAAVAATQAIPSETLAVNQQANFTPVTVSGGTTPLHYSVSPVLPSGLSLNSSTGQITGAHTAVSAAATYTVTVTDANQVAASASFTLAVSTAKTSVAISSSSTGDNSQVNDTVTFVATITPFIGNTALAPPFPGNAAQVTGNVVFEDNGTALCTASVSLTGGIYEATCGTSKLQATPSSHTITASYSGDANYSGSDNHLIQTVSPAPSSMSLTTSPNPSVVENPKNSGDVVNLTAAISPSNGGVPLAGTVAFTDNGIAINGCTAIPVNASTGLATCSSTFSTFGTHSIVAVYGNDSNYTSSQGTATQQVQDYSLTMAPATAVSVTQGSTNANDPFTPQAITITSTSFSGFTGDVALTCTVAAVATTQGAVLPTCSLSAANLAIASGAASQPVAVTINTGSGSTLASPGTYSVFVIGVDATTGLTHATAALTVDVRYDAPPITMASGATTGNTGGLNFILPAGVGITGFQCTSVTGPTLSVSVNPSGLGMGCSFNPSSIAPAGSTQNGSTTLTLSTNVPLSQAKLAHDSESGGGSAIEMAGMIGVPLFMLLGFLPGVKRTRRIFFRYLGIALLAVLLFGGVSGCGGGSFTAPTQAAGTTPPGTYNVLVQGAGTDGHTYEAIVTVNVTR